jgi:adenylate cyclase
MKFTLRVTVLTILLALLLATVGLVGGLAYRNLHFTASDLSTQVLDQTTLRIDSQINDLLRTANGQSAMSQQLLQSSQIQGRDFPRLTAYWLEVMKVHPQLSRLSFGLEADGEWYYVRRLTDGTLALGDLRRNRQTGKLQLRDYWPGEYPHKPFYENADMDREDPRRRPWYAAARAASRQTWSETYVFFGVDGVADVPGVSCATPVYGPDGALVGVVTASFDLYQLCQFLKTLQIGRTGFAFVVEFRKDGSRRVIAHPNPDVLLRVAGQEAHGSRSELMPAGELADRRVPVLLDQLPADLDPSSLTGMTQVRFTQDGVNYLGSYRCLSSKDTPDWLICTIIPEDDVLEHVGRMSRQTMFIALCVLAAAVALSLYISAQMSRPLEQLAGQAAAIGRLHLDAAPATQSIVREVDHLATAMEDMKTGLRSFQKYVPADLVRALLAEGQEARLGGERKTVTIFFSDVADFTAISEELPPEQLIEYLGEYLGVLSTEILRTGGTVDKYIGDAVMAFWGAPGWNPGHALAACTAAVGNHRQLAQLNGRWKAAGKPVFRTRMGVHTGEVIVGNFGSAARMNYTVMGDAVNLASRLEGLNKYYGTEILMSEATYREVEEGVVARPLDWVSVKGKSEAVLVYELLGLKGQLEPEAESLAELYAKALALYRAQDWDRTIQLFEQILRAQPQDAAARLMRGRCQGYQATPPGPQWDGVHRMHEK